MQALQNEFIQMIIMEVSYGFKTKSTNLGFLSSILNYHQAFYIIVRKYQIHGLATVLDLIHHYH